MDSLIFGDIFGNANKITFCSDRMTSQPLLFISEDALSEFLRGDFKHGLLAGIREKLGNTTVFEVVKVFGVDDITRVNQEIFNLDENIFILGWCRRADENEEEIDGEYKHPETLDKSGANEQENSQEQQQEVTPKQIHILFHSPSLRIIIPSENMQELKVSQLEIAQNVDEKELTESTIPYILYRKADDESFFVDTNQIETVEKSASSDSKRILRITKEDIAQKRAIKIGRNISADKPVENEHKNTLQPVRIKEPRNRLKKKHDGDVELKRISPPAPQKIQPRPPLNNIKEMGERNVVSLKNRLKDYFRSYIDYTELYLSRKVVEKCRHHPNPRRQKLYGILGGRIEFNRIIIEDILLEERVKELKSLLNRHSDCFGWCLVEPQIITYNPLIEHLNIHKDWVTPHWYKRPIENPRMRTGLILQQANNSIIVIRWDQDARAFLECSKHFFIE